MISLLSKFNSINPVKSNQTFFFPFSFLIFLFERFLISGLAKILGFLFLFLTSVLMSFHFVLKLHRGPAQKFILQRLGLGRKPIKHNHIIRSVPFLFSFVLL